ncbi:hypothetical protein Acr_01g0013990 [Actinidia rufa]|uniref:Uncharacterized protein n=1 Tax=Actinidia rufa TaxID=165716 RepID=A0A7J0E598_9ERIC|nr:hypothetical protein Acr_01g0013990 [Actinidia rufa]
MDQNLSFLHYLEVALAILPHLSQSKAYIYRVPKELRKDNEYHYTLTTVFIGPFHAAIPSLDAADGRQLKYRALNHLLDRTQTTLSSLFSTLKRMKEEARLFYAVTVDLSSDEFVELMLLDGCFILALHASDYQILVDRSPALLLPFLLEVERGLAELFESDKACGSRPDI